MNKKISSFFFCLGGFLNNNGDCIGWFTVHGLIFLKIGNTDKQTPQNRIYSQWCLFITKQTLSIGFRLCHPVDNILFK